MKLVITHKFDKSFIQEFEVVGVEIDTMTNIISYVPKDSLDSVKVVHMDTSRYYRIELTTENGGVK